MESFGRETRRSTHAKTQRTQRRKGPPELFDPPFAPLRERLFLELYISVILQHRFTRLKSFEPAKITFEILLRIEVVKLTKIQSGQLLDSLHWNLERLISSVRERLLVLGNESLLTDALQ